MNPLIVACLLIAPLLTRASEWVLLVEGPNVTAYVDVQSIRKTQHHVKAWTKWVYSSPQELEATYPKKTYQSEKLLEAYRCQEGTTAPLQRVFYSPDGGDVVHSLKYSNLVTDYSEIVPDSMGETIFNFVCTTVRKSKGH